MKHIYKRFEGASHLNSRYVMMMDVMLAVIASIMAVLILSYLYPQVITGKTFLGDWALIGLFGSVIGFFLTGSYRRSIRHSSFLDIFILVVAAAIKDICLFVLLQVSPIVSVVTTPHLVMLGFDFFLTITMLVGCRMLMVFVYGILRNAAFNTAKQLRVLVVGSDNVAVSILNRLCESRRFKVTGFLENSSETQKGRIMSGHRVFVYRHFEDIENICVKHHIEGFVFTNEKSEISPNRELIAAASNIGVKCYIAPALDKLNESERKPSLDKNNGIREVRVEDLLGRPEIEINMANIESNLRGKTILVTGAAGSIGSELCRQLAGFGVAHLVFFDNAETPLHNLRLEFEENFPTIKFSPVVGDVRLKTRLDFAFKKYRPQVVFHAAAYKHVPLMEESL